MKTKEAIVCALFISGAAVFYDTRDVCDQLAASFEHAVVREINSFNDLNS